jgi:deazaflavin-dependent oxidoreductase (nitroreductase family)
MITPRMGFTPNMADTQVELSPEGWVRGQTEKILESGTTEGIQVQGMPIILLTMKGAKSGKYRYVPLMRVEHDGEYAIVASKGGAPEHPVWYHNVTANPELKLQDGSVTRDYVARELSGDERQVWWDRSVEAFPPYGEYQTKTDRQIPVFVLEPAS